MTAHLVLSSRDDSELIWTAINRGKPQDFIMSRLMIENGHLLRPSAIGIVCSRVAMLLSSLPQRNCQHKIKNHYCFSCALKLLIILYTLLRYVLKYTSHYCDRSIRQAGEFSPTQL